MAQHKLILPGTVFGKLKVESGPYIEPSPYATRKANLYFYECRCECGTVKRYRSDMLRTKTRSCGCGKQFFDIGNVPPNKTHGMGKSRLYGIWNGMIYRCTNPACSNWEDYGGRGISVCPEWLNFDTFREWAMENGYAKNLTIDRIDVNGNYDPINCRWATYIEQERNRRNNIFLTAWGETKVLSEWLQNARCAVRHGTTISRRISKGFSAEDAISQKQLKSHS